MELGKTEMKEGLDLNFNTVLEVTDGEVTFVVQSESGAVLGQATPS